MPKNKLSIGIFTNMLLEPSGIAEATRRLIKGLGRSGNEVHVFAPHDSFHAKNVEYHKCGGFRMSRDPEYYFSMPFFKFFRANRGVFRDLDVCHAIDPMGMGFLAMDVAKFNGLPKVISNHGTLADYSAQYFPIIGKPFKLFSYHYERLVYNRFHVIHTPTYTKKNMIARHGLKEPIFSLTNGLPETYFTKEKASRSTVLSGYNIPDSKKVMLFAGRLGSEKNVWSNIRAMSRVRARGVDAHLVIAGGGPQRKRLEDFASSLHVREHVTFAGWLTHEELIALYDASDVTLLYSDVEAQGLVLLESMARGTPCVGKRAGGMIDVISDGENGFLARDEEQFTDKIHRILSDDAYRNHLGTIAREKTRREHSMPDVIGTWERVYAFMINEISIMHWNKAPRPSIVQAWREFCAHEPLLRF